MPSYLLRIVMDLSTLFGKGKAFPLMIHLPDEMLGYELESQGKLATMPHAAKRKALSALFDTKKYCAGYQNVAIGYIENIRICSGYVKSWKERFDKDVKDRKACESLLVKLAFLHSRLKFIVVPDHDETWKVSLSRTKLDSKSLEMEVENTLNALLGIQPMSSASTFPPLRTRTLDDWTMSSGAVGINSDPLAESLRSIFDRSRPLAAEDSILDLSMSILEDEARTDQRNETLVINSTRRPTFQGNLGSSRARSPPISPISNYGSTTMPFNRSFYTPKVQIWKWGLKFLGQPNTLPVVEFVRRVRELAKARGATEIDLFNGACDLFDGEAVKWFRAGLDNKAFRNWNELEAVLLHDFKAYDYGDNLWEYIRNRLQEPGERVVNYFATMEDLFLKLNRPASELVKVSTIRRNLRSDILKSLSVIEFSTVSVLKEHCKHIENDLTRIHNRNTEFRSREPENIPRRVRFANPKVNAMGCYDQEPDVNHPMSAYPSILDSERDSFHSDPLRGRQERLNAYEDVSDSQWKRNWNELSVREEPYSNYMSVPPPPNSASVQRGTHGHAVVPNVTSSHESAQSNRYSHSSNSRGPSYYPLRRSSAQPSENSQWASNNRTETIPTVIRRPC